MFDETTEPTPPQSPKPSPPGGTGAVPRNAQFRIGALVAILVVLGIILWLALRGGSSKPSNGALSQKAATPTQIQSLAAQVGHPIFWLGPKSGYTYELSRFANGNIEIRYLPPGASVGSKTPYLSVGTYPFTNALAGIQRVAGQRGSVASTLSDGGQAVYSKNRRTNVYAAYPGLDYQAEVYDPTPGAASSLVDHGKLAAVGDFAASLPFSARAMTLDDLRGLSSRLGHPMPEERLYVRGERAHGRPGRHPLSPEGRADRLTDEVSRPRDLSESSRLGRNHLARQAERGDVDPGARRRPRRVLVDESGGHLHGLPRLGHSGRTFRSITSGRTSPRLERQRDPRRLNASLPWKAEAEGPR
jgi:hypothetical protein